MRVTKLILLTALLVPTVLTSAPVNAKSGLTEEVCRPFATKRFDDYARKAKEQFTAKDRETLISIRIERCLEEGMWGDEIDTMAAAMYADAQATEKPNKVCGTAGCAVASAKSGMPEALCRSVAAITSESYAKRKALQQTAEGRTADIESRTRMCLKYGEIWYNDNPPIE